MKDGVDGMTVIAQLGISAVMESKETLLSLLMLIEKQKRSKPLPGGVRGFLGFANFYRWFIRDSSATYDR